MEGSKHWSVFARSCVQLKSRAWERCRSVEWRQAWCLVAHHLCTCAHQVPCDLCTPNPHVTCAHQVPMCRVAQVARMCSADFWSGLWLDSLTIFFISDLTIRYYWETSRLVQLWRANMNEDNHSGSDSGGELEECDGGKWSPLGDKKCCSEIYGKFISQFGPIKAS